MSVLMFGKRSAVTSGESGADSAALLYDTAQIAEPCVLGPSRCTADYHQSDCTRIMQFSCCILQVVLRSAADRHYQTWSEGPARGCVGAQQWGDDCTYVASCTRSTEYTPREMWQRTNCTCVPAEALLLFKNNALIPFTAHIFLHYPPVRIAWHNSLRQELDFT